MTLAALLLLMSSFLYECNLHSSDEEYVQNPFQNFTIKTVDVYSSGNKLLNESFFKDAIKLEGGSVSDKYFQLLENKEGNLILFSQSDQKLFVVHEDEMELNLLAGSGRGPNEIYQGIRLVPSKDKMYLIQRSRISYINNENGIELTVKRNIPKYINYYSELSDNSFLVNTNTLQKKSSFQVVDENFEILDEIGGYVNYKNSDINKLFGFNIVSSDPRQNTFIQVFLFLPYIGIFNNDLKHQKTIYLKKFNSAIINDKKLGRGQAAILETELHSVVAGIHPLKNSSYWIIVENRVYPKKQDYAFEDIRPERTYQYYLIDNDLDMSHIGESQFYMVPFNNKFIFLKNDSLFLTKKSYFPFLLNPEL